MSDIIDINIYPTVETISLTIAPNLTTINVNTVSGGGGAVSSVNGQTGVVVLNQDDVLDGTTYKQYSQTEKTKLAGIAAGAEVNVNADWNAVSGDALILNKPTIPTNTSDLINDGEDGVHPYITLLDLPSNLILYPTTVASDVIGYVKLVTDHHDPDYNVTAVNVSTGSITTTNQLVSSLITVPDLISGNPGVFNISTVGNIRRSAGSGTAEFYFNVYKRDSLGTETLIGVSNPTLPVNNGVYAEFSATAIWDDGVFTATDRIVLKFYGSRISGGSNPTYEFQFGGLTPVRTLVPIPLSVVPSIPNATETVAGIAEISTTAEVTTGTDDARIVTPLKLKQVTDNYMQVILNCNVLGTTVSGGTNIVMYQVNVPANTFSDLDAFEIEALGAKVGTTAVSTIRIWTDTASTFNSGTAQFLAISASLGTTNLFQTIKREFHVRGSTIKCLANTVGIATDEATSTLAANPWASYTFNPAVANTLYFTVTGNAADTFTKQNFKITRYKNKSTI